MADNSSRRGAVDPGTILMVLSFAVIGGFLFWLNGQAAIERALDLVEDTAVETEVVEEVSGATEIIPSDIQPDASGFDGQLVRLRGHSVASRLGEQGFWLDLPSSPFLVSLSAALIAQGVEVTPGSTVTVTGTIRAVNDSIVASWFDAGRISEGDQLAAGFASHFLEADQIEGM